MDYHWAELWVFVRPKLMIVNERWYLQTYVGMFFYCCFVQFSSYVRVCMHVYLRRVYFTLCAASCLLANQISVVEHSGVRRKYQWRGSAQFLPLPSPSSFYSPFLPSQLNQLGVWESCKFTQPDPGRSPGRKRIRCTLLLSESHWWQSV